MRAHEDEIKTANLDVFIEARNVTPDYFAETAPEPEAEPSSVRISENPDSFRAEPASTSYSTGEMISTVVKDLVQPDISKELERTGLLVHELGNPNLPISAFSDEILQSVKNNQVTIIRSETGSGKSTQIGQILFNGGLATTITQPRIAAARNVSERIHDEAADVRGGFFADKLVSLKTGKLEDRSGDYRHANIRVVTDGLLLAETGDVHEGRVIIPDEVHEQNTNTELLLAVARERLQKDPETRLVIMSADADTRRLANYFAPVTTTPPCVLNIPGRTFDVKRLERPQSTVGKETVKAICDLYENGARQGENGILVFAAGVGEIHDDTDHVMHNLPAAIRKQLHIIPLHAQLPAREQQLAMKDYEGIKVVIATEVAQTSLTIPDIKYVIDSGDHRQIELDDEGTQGLFKRPISQSGINQRAGRAGRVQDGTYILTRQKSKDEFVPPSNRRQYEIPEIQRTDIVRHALRVIIMAEQGIFEDAKNIADLPLLNPVDQGSIALAHQALIRHGAIDKFLQSTERGREMNRYPLGVPMARAFETSKQYSSTVRLQMAAIAASVEAGGLPYFGHSVGKRWKQLVTDTSSDLIAQLEIFSNSLDFTERDMYDYDLNVNNIARARDTYNKLAHMEGLPDLPPPPPTPDELHSLRVCIGTGQITTLFKRIGDGWYRNVGDTDSQTPRQISNRSVLTRHPEWLVGTPYRLEKEKSGHPQIDHIIEQATTLSTAEVIEIAADQAEWQDSGLVTRGSKVFAVRTQKLFGQDTGISEEASPEQSKQLNEALVKRMLNQPGACQSELLNIKKYLEQIDRRSPQPIPKLSQEHLLDLLSQAATGTRDAGHADRQLGQIMHDNHYSIDSFISQADREQILQNAPISYVIGQSDYRLFYQNRQPIVAVKNTSTLKELIRELASNPAENFTIPDGRELRFKFERKTYSLESLLSTYAPSSSTDI